MPRGKQHTDKKESANKNRRTTTGAQQRGAGNETSRSGRRKSKPE